MSALLSEQKLFAPLGAKPSTRDLHLLAWVSPSVPLGPCPVALTRRPLTLSPPGLAAPTARSPRGHPRPKYDIDNQPSHPPCSSGWIQRQARPSCLTFRLSERRLVCTDTRSAGRSKEGIRSCARGRNKDQGGRHGTAASNERIGQADKMEKGSVPPTAYKQRFDQQLVKIVYMRSNATLHAAGSLRSQQAMERKDSPSVAVDYPDGKLQTPETSRMTSIDNASFSEIST